VLQPLAWPLALEPLRLAWLPERALEPTKPPEPLRAWPLEPLPVQALGSEPEPLREPPLPLDPISPPEPLAQEPQLARRACSAPHRSAFAALPASPWARPLRD